MKNKEISNKLESLSRDEILKIKTIIGVLEVYLIPTKDYHEDHIKVDEFEDIGFVSLVKLLTKLDKEFNIINFQRRTTNSAVIVSMKEVEDEDFSNLGEKLSNFKDLVYDIDTEKEMIKKITFVDPSLGYPYKVIFNDDYVNYKEANKNPLYWQLLRRIALDEPVERKDVENQYTHLANVDRFPFKNEYAYTKILKLQDGYLIPNIEFEKPINNNEFNKRRKKQLAK